MIVQHEQQHDETMLATHQLRAGPPVLAAPPPPPGRPLPAGAGAGARGAVHDGHVHRAVGAGQRAARARRRRARVPDRHRAGHQRGVRRVRRRGRLRRPALVDRGGLARTAPRPGSSRPRSGPATRTARGGGGASACVEPVPPTSRWCTCAAHEAEAYAAWAGSAAAHRGRVGEGGPLRPGHRPLAPLPVGRRRPDARARQPRAAPPLSPPRSGAYPAGASPLGVHQLIGDVWEWTASGWHPYPGFAAFPYREYSEVFFGGDYRVLRGGSFGTDPAAVPRHVPQLGPPDPPADLRGVPAGPGRGAVARCAATWPTWARRSRCRRWCSSRRTRCCAQSCAPLDMRGGGTINADGFGVGWYAGAA